MWGGPWLWPVSPLVPLGATPQKPMTSGWRERFWRIGKDCARDSTSQNSMWTSWRVFCQPTNRFKIGWERGTWEVPHTPPPLDGSREISGLFPMGVKISGVARGGLPRLGLELDCPPGSLCALTHAGNDSGSGGGELPHPLCPRYNKVSPW